MVKNDLPLLTNEYFFSCLCIYPYIIYIQRAKFTLNLGVEGSLFKIAESSWRELMEITVAWNIKFMHLRFKNEWFTFYIYLTSTLRFIKSWRGPVPPPLFQILQKNFKNPIWGLFGQKRIRIFLGSTFVIFSYTSK